MSGIYNEECKLLWHSFKDLIQGDPVDTGAFYGNMGTTTCCYPVTEFFKSRSESGKFTDFGNGSSANRAGEDTGNDDVFMHIQPAAFFKKVFHKVKLLSEYSQAEDLPEMIGTLLPCYPKVRQYAVLEGKKFTLTNGVRTTKVRSNLHLPNVIINLPGSQYPYFHDRL